MAMRLSRRVRKRLAAQSVICAQFEDHDLRLVACQRGCEAIASAQACLAADTGIDYTIIETVVCQLLLQQIDPALPLRQPVASR